MKDPYSVLGIDPSVSDEAVKKAYRELARKYHPDNYQNNPLADLAEEKMKEINEAYDTITKQRAGGGAAGGYQTTSGSYQTGYSSAGYGPQGYSQQSYGGTTNPTFNRIRQLINANDLAGAENLLFEVPQKSGEWYFLSGSIAYRKGWLDEAMQNYAMAVQMEPNNMEYRQALAMMQQRTVYRPYGGGSSSMANVCSDACTTYLCLSCLCPGNQC